MPEQLKWSESGEWTKRSGSKTRHNYDQLPSRNPSLRRIRRTSKVRPARQLGRVRRPARLHLEFWVIAKLCVNCAFRLSRRQLTKDSSSDLRVATKTPTARECTVSLISINTCKKSSSSAGDFSHTPSFVSRAAEDCRRDNVVNLHQVRPVPIQFLPLRSAVIRIKRKDVRVGPS